MKRKSLYLIGGPMGIGKSTVCQELKQQLSNCAFLDGDWCWDMDPFIVSDSTKHVALDNIIHCLNNFLSCPDFENIIFCWVMHERETINSILSSLTISDCTVYTYTLVCEKEVLIHRLNQDIALNKRGEDIIEKSLDRLSSCLMLDTRKIECSHLSPKQVAHSIAAATISTS